MPQAKDSMYWQELVGVFLVSFAVLLFQVTATKIAEYSLWSNYAFLIISTAMFGLGLSGVIMTRWPGLLKVSDARFFSVNTVLCAFTIVTAFLGLNSIPIHLPDAPDGWTREIVNLSILFLVLGVPFIFFGLIITGLFEKRSEKAGIYYCADLLGAGLGSLALMILIPWFAPQGLVLLAVLITLAAAPLFLVSSSVWSKGVKQGSVVMVLALAGCGVLLMPSIADRFPLQVHVAKRNYKTDLLAGNIETTGWSALSRVDVSPLSEGAKRVWIAGGVNESSIIKFDGDFEKLRAGREDGLSKAADIINYQAYPHVFKNNHTVCMIGTSGGADSLYALSLGARHVVGVEMDPGVAAMVTEKYNDWAGGLFTDGKYSELVIDEGRSFLRRSERKFDVIQQVNNFTPIAFMNGALNLSETYLLTVESFREFYDHLTDDGILSISRYGSFRMLTIAVEMFRQMGMKPEEYAKHILIVEGNSYIIPTLMLKKSPFTEQEIKKFEEFFYKHGRRRSILWGPYTKVDDNFYKKVVTSDNPEQYYRNGAYDFTPPTDEKPFFNHCKQLGQSDQNRAQLPLIPIELRKIEPPNVLKGRVPPGDIPPLLVLFEAIVMATLFIGLPMLSRKKLRQSLWQEKIGLLYFACIGLAFIFVEVCLIQRLVLFLGVPVYSISAVFCSLLVTAGLGSLLSSRINPSKKNMICLLVVVSLMVFAMHLVLPYLTQTFLGHTLPVRMVLAISFVGLCGVFMGMPMPLGVRYLNQTKRPIISWGWAINGYFSVIGSALSVLIALNFGFGTVFGIAAICYMVAPFFLVAGQKTIK